MGGSYHGAGTGIRRNESRPVDRAGPTSVELSAPGPDRVRPALSGGGRLTRIQAGEGGPNVPEDSDITDLRRQIRRIMDKHAPADRPGAGTPRERSGRGGDSSRPHPAVIYPRDLPPAEPAPAPPPGDPAPLEELIDGEEVAHPVGGSAFLVSAPVRETPGGWDRLSDAFAAALRREDSYLRNRLRDGCGCEAIDPDDVVFVDLETCGLGSAPLFLIGTMVYAGDGLAVRQYFARNYAEERAVLSMFLDDAADRSLLVSFNGKSFDWPFVRMRAAATGVPLAIDPPHFDLLHESRRVWRSRLPDCKLQTLERHVCRRRRDGDIPGHAIPDAYHAYVRTADARQMVEVLRHNRLDLITLADLMVRISDAAEG